VDEMGFDIVMEEAAKYYANIVLPYGAQVQKLLAAASELDIEMIAPAHGLIWNSHLPEILDAYSRWAANVTQPKAVIVYDTMWQSTQKLADALKEGLESEDVPVTLGWLQRTHVSDLMTHILEARGILVGSPTLNSRVFPSVAGALTYIGGLRPRGRLGLAFGSYGWARQGVSGIEKMMDEVGWERPVESVGVQWVPGDQDLERARKAGAEFGKRVKAGV
jgi:flavorubredoxin